MTCHSLRSLDLQIGAIIAQCEAMRATVRAAIESSENHAPSATVTLEEHGRRTGRNTRKRREDFSAFERHGFKVHRAGHAAWMDADEYARAVEALASKRPASTSNPTVPASAPALVAHNDDDDDSPAALLSRAGLSPTRSHNPNPRTPKRRAA